MHKKGEKNGMIAMILAIIFIVLIIVFGIMFFRDYQHDYEFTKQPHKVYWFLVVVIGSIVGIIFTAKPALKSLEKSKHKNDRESGYGQGRSPSGGLSVRSSPRY